MQRHLSLVNIIRGSAHYGLRGNRIRFRIAKKKEIDRVFFWE